ncbi:MAG: protein-glutamate O-methyltransferase CheR [Pseudomonadota bacterium]
MQDTTFNALADLALESTGQFIASSKSYLVEARLSSILRREGFASCDDLAACLKARPNPVLSAEVAAALQTRRTRFFRDNDMLERIVGDVLPRKLKLSKAGRIKIWCAGVSTGEEAFSLAILLHEQERALRGARIEILATDICRSALDSARAGTFGHYSIQNGLSVHRLLAYFDELETGQWQANEELRRAITFRHHNLIDAEANLGQFDIIVCRHVLSGMAKSIRSSVAERLSDSLLPEGLLVLGHGETLTGISNAFEPSRRHRGGWDAIPAARRVAA